MEKRFLNHSVYINKKENEIVKIDKLKINDSQHKQKSKFLHNFNININDRKSSVIVKAQNLAKKASL